MKDGYVANKDTLSSMLCISFSLCIYFQVHPFFLFAERLLFSLLLSEVW